MSRENAFGSACIPINIVAFCDVAESALWGNATDVLPFVEELCIL